jgi:deoxyribodipyrimidine photo-lyase
MHKKMTIFWFRRDLRLADNHGLFAALSKGEPVQAIFIFDKNILSKLTDKNDARISFIHQQLLKLNAELAKLGSSLWVFYGDPLSVFKNELQAKMPNNTSVGDVYANHDYEPNAIQRDAAINDWLLSKNNALLTFKDQCIFEKKEVVKDDGLPYTVFTAYKNKYYKTLTAESFKSYDSQKYFTNFYANNGFPMPSLEEIGFEPSEIEFPVIEFESILKEYANTRNFPSVKGTSRISVHLRFGTVSIRALAKASFGKSETWFNELVWRDFYFQILWHFPYVVDSAFKPNYNHIEWRKNEDEFEKWCNGQTGYPIVDAGMRELNATGFMHNRVRMIVASFLTKHLLISWQWGEAYFAKKLLDFELSSNNGGWQWAAGCGCDAAPYFRIFNPAEQTKKFDPKFSYIKKWVPEFQEFHYPAPIVDHKFARERCLQTYKVGLQKL